MKQFIIKWGEQNIDKVYIDETVINKWREHNIDKVYIDETVYQQMKGTKHR